MWIHLVPEERVIERNNNRILEWCIVSELLEGSAYNNNRTIPADVSILSVHTTDNTSYVNFSAAFRSEGGSLAEMFMIYSIVNSLTELEHVDKVQFLVNNNLITDDMGFNLNLGSPVKRDASWIGAYN
jgi:germination protein M